MKRTFLVVSLCLVASLSFAQKKAVKDAKVAMKNNLIEARELIMPAFTDAETKDSPETWKVAGDIEYKAFSDEREKEQLKTFTKTDGDEVMMYTGLFNMVDLYIKADQLAQLPDEKGKLKNKVRKDIANALKDGHPFFVNGGVYYNEQRDFKKAADFFEKYWEIPSLELFEGDNSFNTNDSTFQTIKYYAIVCAIQAEDHTKAIKLLNKINTEPYIENSTFKESDTYELLASEYQTIGDTISFENTLLDGAMKFPNNQFFTPNLINVYIKGGQIQKALAYIDQAILNDPSNACDLYSVKASLYSEKKEYAEAIEVYNMALGLDPNCKRSLEGLGLLYILQAQDIKEKAAQATNRKEQAELDKKTEEFYKLAIEPLERYRSILAADNADALDLKQALIKLQNIYYNMNMSDEFEQINKEMEKLNSEDNF